jgi:hypothetical protein
MRIEHPVLGLRYSKTGRPFYDMNWQPDQKYWTGHQVVVPEPYQAGVADQFQPVLPWDYTLGSDHRTVTVERRLR